MLLTYGIYADLRLLYSGQSVETVQQALMRSAGGYREMGIHHVEKHPSFVYFPTVREYDYFVADMKEQGCIPHERFVPISTALEVILKAPVKVEKTVSDGKSHLFLALTASYSLYDARVVDYVKTPALIFQAVEQSVEQILMLGITGTGDFSMIVRGLKIDVTALEFTQAQFIKKNTGSKFFVMFDWFFDWIDRIFASGSGQDFNMMGEMLLPKNRQLINQAIKEALFTALDDNYTIEIRDMRAKVRVLIEQRQAFLDGLDQVGGVNVLDDFHDGTYWTFDIGLKTQTFYNNRSFASVLEQTNAEIINQRIKNIHENMTP